MSIVDIKQNFLSACVDNDFEKFKHYLKKNSDYNIFRTGYTLLACNGHYNALKYLLDNTNSENLNDELKYWIFINGASNNHKNIIELIIQYNFNINYSPDYTQSPLEYCI